MKTVKNDFRGIIPPLVTPLKSNQELDRAGLEKLVEHVLAGGVHGLFILGTTGEGPSLGEELKREMISRVCRQVGKRVPVLVAITDTSFTASLALAEHAADCGVSAAVIAPPYYFAPSQAELLEYLGHLAPQLPLPLFLYNMPSMTKVNIQPSTLRQAAEIKGIIGFKDSGGDMIRFHEYLCIMRELPDFPLLMGPEELLGESVLFGGHGGISGGANIFPSLYVEIYEAARDKNIGRVLAAQEKIFRLRRIYACGKYSSSYLKGVKCALSCMGICSDFMADPFHAFREAERLEVKRLLVEMDIECVV